MAAHSSKYTWQREALLHSSRRYAQMVDCLTAEPRYANTLVSIVDPAEADKLAKALLHISERTDSTFRILESLIQQEFKQNHFDPTAILRGNCVASKIQSMYSRNAGADYARSLFGEILSRITSDESINFEIDRNKLIRQSVPENELDSVINEHVAALDATAQEVLDMIVSKTGLDDMPRPIRCIAGLVADCATVVCPDRLPALVGGFVMLRFFCPALVAPEAYGLSDPDELPSPRARRCLVLLAKILQNVTNGVKFGGKEQYMLPMNDFIERNIGPVEQYLRIVCMDPEVTAGLRENSWSDFMYEDIMRGGRLDMKVDVKSMDIMQLIALHTLLDSNTMKLMDRLLSSAADASLPFTFKTRSGGRHRGKSVVFGTDLVTANDSEEDEESEDEESDSSDDSSDDDLDFVGRVKPSESEEHVVEEEEEIEEEQPDHSAFLSLLAELGPPPPITSGKFAERARRHGPTTGPKEDFDSDDEDIDIPTINDHHVGEHQEEYRRANFFYVGPKKKKNDMPAYYIIVDRIEESMYDKEGLVRALAQYVMEVMGPDLDAPYMLVVDMSWSKLLAKERLATQRVADFIRSFTRAQRKNLHKLFILQPNAFTRSMMASLRSVISRKVASKVIEVSDWKDLLEYIPTAEAGLPDESKDFLTKLYQVVKINHKGRRQSRLVKFTNTSLLNIEPRTRTVRNELLMSQIIELTAKPKSLEIEIIFDDTLEENPDGSVVYYRDRAEQAEAQKQSINFSRQNQGVFTRVFSSRQEGRQVRRYECASEEDRAGILADLFFVAWHLDDFQSLPQQYAVIKVNKAGRRQNRVFKLTQDSLLNLKANEIRSEISFAGIQSVELEREKPNQLLIHYKSRSDPQLLIFRGVGGAEQMVQSIDRAIMRYQVAQERENEALRQDAVNAVSMRQ